MGNTIDQALLDSYCGEDPGDDHHRILTLLAKMGPLGRWVVSRQLLTRVGVTPQQLPETTLPGQFHAVVAVRQPDRFPVLRPAFLLPLRWQRGVGHSPKLPKCLRDAADDVLRLFQKTASAAEPSVASSWRLTPSFLPETEAEKEPDLRGLELSPDSATAAMFAALRLAEWGVCGQGRVLASIDCRGGSLKPVRHVDRKRLEAADCGARRLYLCQASDGPAASGATGEAGGPEGDHLEVRRLEPRDDIAAALQPYLEELEAPPRPDEDLEKHATFYERALRDRQFADQRRDYYLSHPLKALAAKCLNQPVVEAIGKRGQITHLIGCVAPGQPPAVALLAATLAPKVVWLVHTPVEKKPDLEKDLQAIEQHFQKGGVGNQAAGCTVRRWSSKLTTMPLADLTENLRELLREVEAEGAGRIVVDLTNGPKRLLLAFLEAAAGHTCLLVDSEQTDRGVYRLGSEQIVEVPTRSPPGVVPCTT